MNAPVPSTRRDAQHKYVERLRLLYKVLTRRQDDLGVQLSEALALVTGFLELDLGIISRVEGDRYTVTHCYAPGAAPQPGDRFSLGNTCCAITLEADDVLSIDHMADSAHRHHPCYAAFALETYIGVPLFVNGERYGTLNFSSATPRAKAFGDEDREFVRLLGQWVGAILERQQTENALRRSEALLNRVLATAPMGVIAYEAVRDEEANVTDFAFLKANPVTEIILRRPEKDLLGKRLGDILPHLVGSSLFRNYSTVVDTGEPYTDTFFMPAESSLHGTDAWYALSAAQLGDGLVVTYADVTEHKNAEENMRRLAYYDELAGLPNRRAFFERAATLQALAQRRGWTIALLFVDINGFKAVNDTQGHEVGDRLIKEVAARLRGVVRGEEPFARMGGDEFALLLSDVDEADAARVAERVVAALSQPYALGNATVRVGASVGIALGEPNDKIDLLLRRADEAMYRVKAQGTLEGGLSVWRGD